MRTVGLAGATALGVGSMVGAGAFVVWGPAAAAAGSWLVWAVVVAAVVAALNAGSTAQLAAVYPVAGGAYAFGRAELSPTVGFIAGLGFVVGKTASIAAIALTVGTYLWPEHPAAVASAVTAAAWALNSRGITRTARAAVVIVIAVGAVLLLAIIAMVGAGISGDGGITVGSAGTVVNDAGAVVDGGTAGGGAAPDVAAGVLGGQPGTVAGVLGAAALVFFAFAGYARVATLGEEVRDPARVLPRAIGLALGLVLALYLALAVVLPRVLGDTLAGSTAPVAQAVEGTWMPAPVVAAAAAVAATGSLLALIAGVGRTTMAMARTGDLPRALARTTRAGVPALAEALVAAVAIALTWVGSLGVALAASSFAVLLYYAIAGLAAFRAAGAGRVTGWRMPRPLSLLGAALCLALIVFLPVASSAVAAALLGCGIAIRAVLVWVAPCSRGRRRVALSANRARPRRPPTPPPIRPPG